MNLLLIPPLSSIRVMLTDRPSFNSDSMWIRKTLLPLVPYLSFHLLISSALLTSSGNICLAALDIFQDTISTFKCASGQTLTDEELFWDKKNLQPLDPEEGSIFDLWSFNLSHSFLTQSRGPFISCIFSIRRSCSLISISILSLCWSKKILTKAQAHPPALSGASRTLIDL